jgi:hypothetical protein
LAQSIRKYGLQESLIITADGYVVSGHRRLAALLKNGQEWCQCRVLSVQRADVTKDEYIRLLREHNRQRNKSAAEQVREELVDIDLDGAHLRLRQQRDRSVNAMKYHAVSALQIEGHKRRYEISGQKADHLKFIKKVVFEDRQDYWPLSVRAVHYALLNYQFNRNLTRKLRYLNDDNSYQATSNLITRLRLNNEIPWRAFDDGTRPLRDFNPYDDAREFVQSEVQNLFRGYWRNLLQTQPNHVEIVCEKNTIYHMVLRVAEKYQIPTSSGRGFNSIDPWHDLRTRYENSAKQRLIVIVLSDFDPEGEMIPQVGGRTLRDDFNLDDVEIIKAGVTREQIERYSLPPQNFAKETSSNYKWFVARNGGRDAVYELEALNPADMLRELEGVVQSVLDMELYRREVEAERSEAAYIEAAHKTAIKSLKGLGR